jgi:tetratricopeptide (TPR) repeat protein
MPAVSPDQLAYDAQTAFEQGDVVTASQLIGKALVTDPHRKEWLALLSQIVDAVVDPLDLVPLKPSGMTVGEIAVRAYTLFKRQRYHEAIDLLLQAAVAAPHSPLLDWGLAWLKKPETATELNCHKLAGRFKTILDELPRIRATPSGGAALLVRLGPLLRRIRETQVCDATFLIQASVLLRKVPELPEAYETAREAHELDPSYATCVALAGVFRDREDWDRAARWYQDALNYRDDDIPARLDLGDMLWNAGRLDEVEHWYRAAIKVDPENAWATPSLYAVRYERTGDEQYKDRLDDYILHHPANPRARDMRDKIGPYFSNWLPEPAEASLGVVRMMVEKWHEGREVYVESISITWLEAPSVHLAYDLQMAREGRNGRLTVEAANIARPDVRRPRVPVTCQLWRYRGTDPVKALTAPPTWVEEAAARIAASPYRLKSWLEMAAEVAPSIGPTRARDVQALMIHPPPMPPEVTPWAWVQRVQIASAMILAKLERPWKGSTRRQALFDVANGPLDWTTIAAILALSVLVDDEPEVADDVAALFNEMLRDAPQGGYVCHLHPLVCAYQRLPNLTSDEHRDLARWRRELERG